MDTRYLITRHKKRNIDPMGSLYDKADEEMPLDYLGEEIEDTLPMSDPCEEKVDNMPISDINELEVDPMPTSDIDEDEELVHFLDLGDPTTYMHYEEQVEPLVESEDADSYNLCRVCGLHGLEYTGEKVNVTYG